MFVGKVRTITRPGTLVLLFFKAVYILSEANECLTSVNMKRNSEVK